MKLNDFYEKVPNKKDEEIEYRKLYEVELTSMYFSIEKEENMLTKNGRVKNTYRRNSIRVR